MGSVGSGSGRGERRRGECPLGNKGCWLVGRDSGGVVNAALLTFPPSFLPSFLPSFEFLLAAGNLDQLSGEGGEEWSK